MARILINHFSPIPNKITGITVYTWKIVEALVQHGRHEYVLGTNWDRDWLPEKLKVTGMEVVTRKVHRNETVSLFQNTLEVPTLMDKLGCSAVFHPQPTSMLARMKKSAVVIHDLYRVTNPELFNWKQRMQWQQFTARGFRQAGALIAVSGATRDATVTAYPDVRSKISVVHEASPVQGGVVPRTGKFGDAPYGLMVANITPNKNVKLLIDALGILAASGVRPRIYIAGRDEFGVLPGLIANAPDIDFIQLGGVSDEDLRELYAHARVYINTSLVEGFCLPVLEAHTFAVPVICSDLPVLREVAGDGATFIHPDNPAQLADAIKDVFSDEKLILKLSEAARVNNNRFSWQASALKTEKILENLF